MYHLHLAQGRGRGTPAGPCPRVDLHFRVTYQKNCCPFSQNNPEKMVQVSSLYLRSIDGRSGGKIRAIAVEYSNSAPPGAGGCFVRRLGMAPCGRSDHSLLWWWRCPS